MACSIAVQHDEERVEVFLFDRVHSAHDVPLDFLRTWRRRDGTGLDPPAGRVDGLQQVAIFHHAGTQLESGRLHIFEYAVKKCVDGFNLLLGYIVSVPPFSVEDNPQSCGDVAHFWCTREVHSVHLEVHAYIVYGVFAACVPVELVCGELCRGCQFLFTLGRCEPLSDTIDLNLVCGVVIRGFDFWIADVFLGFGEFEVILVSIFNTGTEIDRRLSFKPALVHNRNVVRIFSQVQ